MKTDKKNIIITKYKVPTLFLAEESPPMNNPRYNIKKGLKKNKGFEACSSYYLNETLYLVAINEEPLLQDKGIFDGEMRRFTTFSLKDNDSLGEAFCESSYSYRVTKIDPNKYITHDNFTILEQDTGVSEVLRISDEKFWVVERTHILFKTENESKSKNKTIISIFEVDLEKNKKATNICYKDTINHKEEIIFLEKSPVMVLENFNINIEGMTLGPCFNGKKLLVMANDNNFKCEQDDTHFLFYGIDDENCKTKL